IRNNVSSSTKKNKNCYEKIRNHFAAALWLLFSTNRLYATRKFFHVTERAKIEFFSSRTLLLPDVAAG
ncbi:MAG: hypothetical protein M3Y60_02055, partial [Bacteroidota bacterium]|nr:hypothetical protein [Bacteroidota bacterium]